MGEPLPRDDAAASPGDLPAGEPPRVRKQDLWPDPKEIGRLRYLHWYWTRRHRENWWQLTRFSIVGGSGYVVNLAVFAGCLALGLHYRLAAVVAFGVANVNNYVWNRVWSFPTAEHSMLAEYLRFLLVGLVALALNIVLLTLFVERAGMAEFWAQALAVVLVTPIGFVGNKLFTFRARNSQLPPD